MTAMITYLCGAREAPNFVRRRSHPMTRGIVAIAVAVFLLLGGTTIAADAQAPTGPSANNGAPGSDPSAAFDKNGATAWWSQPGSWSGSWSVLTYGWPDPVYVAAVQVLHVSAADGETAWCSLDGFYWTRLVEIASGTMDTGVLPLAAVCRYVNLRMSPPAGASIGVAEFIVTAYPTTWSAALPLPRPYWAMSHDATLVIGDSLTQGLLNRTPAYGEFLPIFASTSIFNAGKGGDRTDQMLTRLRAMLGTGATVIVVMGGTNDLSQGVPEAITRDNIDAMVALARSAGVTPVVMIPPPSANLPGSAGLRTLLLAYGVAAGVLIVDPWPAMEDPDHPGAMRPGLSDDGTHPTSRGALVLARTLAQALGWSGPGE